MKILFELGQKSHERHQTGVIDALRNLGHEVVKSACTSDCPGLEEFKLPTDDHRNLLAFSAYIRNDQWGRLAYVVRTTRDYLRYLMPEHSGSDVIRHRARNMLKIGYDELSAKDAEYWLSLVEDEALSSTTINNLEKALETIESSIPPHPDIVEYVRQMNIDIFCVTPMLMTQYGQTDLVKAVKSLGIPVVFLAGSWDNLTTKGTVHVLPDRTLVWNDIQVDEAELFHAIPKDTVIAAGAPRFDEFWEREIEIAYTDYCAGFGFDPEQQMITYLGSSNLIVKDEISFVRNWIEALRACDVPTVAQANILLRPHPKFSAGWQDAFGGINNVGLSISKLLNNDSTLFHALAHSRAVVGANTSAELEAAILDCPVFTIKDPTFVSGQDGTIHFGYLAGDLAEVANSLDQHVSQLAAEMSRPRQKNKNDAFLRFFLRPMGLEKPASLTTAHAIETAIELRKAPDALPSWTPHPAVYATANRKAASASSSNMFMRFIKKTARTLNSGL